ncbi:hypothetical protein FACS1894198_4840 [Clostridia bacterium]|nr:hypothetical protein FACS1894198_4840 [Clostridia bacterium]
MAIGRVAGVEGYGGGSDYPGVATVYLPRGVYQAPASWDVAWEPSNTSTQMTEAAFLTQLNGVLQTQGLTTHRFVADIGVTGTFWEGDFSFTFTDWVNDGYAILDWEVPGVYPVYPGGETYTFKASADPGGSITTGGESVVDVLAGSIGDLPVTITLWPGWELKNVRREGNVYTPPNKEVDGNVIRFNYPLELVTQDTNIQANFARKGVNHGSGP